jgi:hypothetical protein
VIRITALDHNLSGYLAVVKSGENTLDDLMGNPKLRISGRWTKRDKEENYSFCKFSYYLYKAI